MNDTIYIKDYNTCYYIYQISQFERESDDKISNNHSV
jgi:hypothetical protein